MAYLSVAMPGRLSGRLSGRRVGGRGARGYAALIFVAGNALAFWLVRPGVPDLWAARARASAAAHGVGLTYWFSWFGGSTPGNYSVITPFLCAHLGTETVVAVAAVALAAAMSVLVRNTARPELARWLAVFGIVLNLWCGRVPFLLGSALAAVALVSVRRRRAAPGALLAIAATLASPVAGAFLCLGLSGVLFSARLRAYRPTALWVISAAAATLATLAVVFGVPGPEPFPAYLVVEIVAAVLLMVLIAPPGHLRTTLALSALGALVLFVVPNGMGANLSRFALFCLLPAAAALSRRRLRTVALLVLPIVVLGVLSSESAFVSAAKPGSSPAHYAALATELDTLHATGHRVELVGTAHAAYAALLDHATLARGWETQEDLARNSSVDTRPLDTARYRAWLDANAVGLVALDLPGGTGTEAQLITTRRPGYLRLVWQSAQWQLFAVTNAVPIVAAPAAIVASSQAALTVRVPCACQVALRVRWSKFLSVHAQLPDGTPDTTEDAYRAQLGPTPDGWSMLTTNRPGNYVLSGAF